MSVDLARDLIDHRMVDCDDQDAGMVDDLWVRWDARSGRLGPLVTGGAVLVAQLGILGRPVARAAAAAGIVHAGVWREIAWEHIAGVERPQTRLLLGRAELALLPGPEPADPNAGGAMLFTEISRLSVVTSDGVQLGLLDIRTQQHTGAPPSVLGILASRRTRGRSIALKRYASTAPRLGGIAHTAVFVPWSDIITVTPKGIAIRTPLDALTPLVCAPDPGPPPMPEAVEAP